jgi:integrase
MRKARGHVRPHGAGFEVAVPVGRDPIMKRYTYAYEQAATLEEAEAVRERMLAARQAGRELRDKATFGQLLDAMLEVAHLDFNTRVIYQGYIDRTIRPALGSTPSTSAPAHIANYGKTGIIVTI